MQYDETKLKLSDINEAIQNKVIPFTELNCEENESYAREVWDLTGKQIVPTIVINDKIFVGFAENLKEISELLI